MKILTQTTLLAAISAVLLSARPVTAQSAAFVGITGGATVGDFGSVNANSRAGGTAGVVLGYRNFNWFVVNVEGLWAQRGAEGIRLDYIEVPLLIGAVGRFGDRGRGRARLYSGIQAGFNVSCEEDPPTPGRTSCDATKTPIWSWPVGLQLGWWAGSTYVGVDGRYFFSLTDAFTTSSAYTRGWTFKLVLGWSIG